MAQRAQDLQRKTGKAHGRPTSPSLSCYQSSTTGQSSRRLPTYYQPVRPSTNCADYSSRGTVWRRTALATALKNRFGNNHQAELNRAHLRSRTKKRDESLPELAEDVGRLTRLAYPESAETMIVVLAKDQCIDALPDKDMRLRIRQSRPPDLRQALESIGAGIVLYGEQRS